MRPAQRASLSSSAFASSDSCWIVRIGRIGLAGRIDGIGGIGGTGGIGVTDSIGRTMPETRTDASATAGQLNLPNMLTVLRIVLVPVVLFGLLQETANGDVIAGVAFAVAASTDWLDGYYARSRGIITTFGKVMDPIADKLLIVGTLVTLSALDRMSWWATGLVLGREFAVTGLRYARKEDGVMSASQYGKLKTVLQSFVLLIVIVAQPSTAVYVLIWVMVAVTLLTGLDYFVHTGRRMDEKSSASAPSD